MTELAPNPSYSVRSAQFSSPTMERSFLGVCSRKKWSPLDALLALAADVHRVLDLRHLRHQIGGVEQLLRGIATGDDDVLGAVPRRQDRNNLVDVDPPPLQRVGELVEHVEVVLLRGEATRDLRPAIGGGGRMVTF